MLLFAGISAEAKTRRVRPPSRSGVYEATAYSQSGITASGEYTHRHIVAADPAILPIGTRIKIRWAGPYSGEYVVADSGSKIQGRRLDIYIPNVEQAKKFGKRPVKVKVIELGTGTEASARKADQEVKVDVARDIRHDGVEHAATKQDLIRAGVVPPSSSASDVAENEPPTKSQPSSE